MLMVYSRSYHLSLFPQQSAEKAYFSTDVIRATALFHMPRGLRECYPLHLEALSTN